MPRIFSRRSRRRRPATRKPWAFGGPCTNACGRTAKTAADLDRAIRAYARGYFLKTDYYNGINFAYLLNVRSSISAGDEAIADRVQARRIRSEVLALCEELLGNAAG